MPWTPRVDVLLKRLLQERQIPSGRQPNVEKPGVPDTGTYDSCDLELPWLHPQIVIRLGLWPQVTRWARHPAFEEYQAGRPNQTGSPAPSLTRTSGRPNTHQPLSTPTHRMS